MSNTTRDQERLDFEHQLFGEALYAPVMAVLEAKGYRYSRQPGNGAELSGGAIIHCDELAHLIADMLKTRLTNLEKKAKRKSKRDWDDDDAEIEFESVMSEAGLF